jgi:hypothetical protein
MPAAPEYRTIGLRSRLAPVSCDAGGRRPWGNCDVIHRETSVDLSGAIQMTYAVVTLSYRL